MGRITNRSDVANNSPWTYDATSKHRLTQAGSAAFTYSYDNNGNVTNRFGQSITWNAYNYPLVINNSAIEKVTHSYDVNHQRWKAVYVNGVFTETSIYVDKLMEKVTTGTNVDYRHYIFAGNNNTAIAIMSRTSAGANNTRYVLKDHQQSPSSIRDSTGNLVVNTSFTAYGNSRNANTWSGAATNADLNASAAVTRQGYTGQTSLGNMGLNHMNGRVQDAITGRFLSADPYITEPGNTQNYNRYSYVLNNPLSLTDPSGFSQEGCGSGTSNTCITDGSYGSGTGGAGDSFTTIPFHGLTESWVFGFYAQPNLLMPVPVAGSGGGSAIGGAGSTGLATVGDIR